jgi:CheY-like chemotaxis protein
MTIRAEHAQTPSATRQLRTVAVVSQHPHQHVFETVLGAVEHDVVVVGTIGHAYSLIKDVAPDLVIVCLESDDWDGCQVLSMLALDSATSRIPVRTYVSALVEYSGDNAAAEALVNEAVPELIELIAGR